MADDSKLITGARTRFSIGGKKVGYASGVSLSESINYQDVEVLDNIEDEEHVPLGYKVTMSANKFRIVNETMKSLGFMPKTGQSSKEHLTNILTNGTLTATLEDTHTGKILQTVEKVRVASQNLKFDARGVSGEDVEFKCIRVKDESEVA